MEKLYLEMRNAFYNINFFLDTLDFESKDEYKKINRTYFLTQSFRFCISKDYLRNFCKKLLLRIY